MMAGERARCPVVVSGCTDRSPVMMTGTVDRRPVIVSAPVSVRPVLMSASASFEPRSTAVHHALPAPDVAVRELRDDTHREVPYPLHEEATFRT